MFVCFVLPNTLSIRVEGSSTSPFISCSSKFTSLSAIALTKSIGVLYTTDCCPVWSYLFNLGPHPTTETPSCWACQCHRYVRKGSHESLLAQPESGYDQLQGHVYHLYKVCTKQPSYATSGARIPILSIPEYLCRFFPHCPSQLPSNSGQIQQLVECV